MLPVLYVNSQHRTLLISIHFLIIRIRY